jgi:hypothetical protein
MPFRSRPEFSGTRASDDFRIEQSVCHENPAVAHLCSLRLVLASAKRTLGGADAPSLSLLAAWKSPLVETRRS